MRRLAVSAAALVRFSFARRTFAFRRTVQPLLCEANMADRSSDLNHDNSYGGRKNPHVKDFDMPTFIYFADGIEHDFMDDVRDCLLRHTNLKTSFTQAKSWTHAELLKVATDVVKSCNISYGDYAHTPRRFWAMLEVMATFDGALAVVTAEHFLFATLAATRATRTASEKILKNTDDVGSLGAIAVMEAHGSSILTEARVHHYEKCVILQGEAKFAVVNGVSARWLFVSAKVVKGNTQMGLHSFFVRIRHDSGELVDGVTACAIKDGVESTGMAVVHFNNVRLSPDLLATPSQFNDQFEVIASPSSAPSTSRTSYDLQLQQLLMSRRLASGSIYCGTLKRAFTNLVNFVAKRKTLNAFSIEEFYLFGLQHIQTPLCALGSSVFLVQLGWQKITDAFGDTSKKPTGVQIQEMHSVLHFLLKFLRETEQQASGVMMQHAVFRSSALDDIRLVTTVMCEGDATFHARTAGKGIIDCTRDSEVSFFDRIWIGRSKYFARLKRFLSNPGFNPLLPVPDQHVKFYCNKYLDLRERLRLRSQMELRVFGHEDVWFYWNCTAHVDVTKCGEAIGEAFITKHFAEVIRTCQDEVSQRYFAQLFLFFSISRLRAEREYLSEHGLLNEKHSNHIKFAMDDACMRVAPSLLRATLALRVPDAFLGPSHTGLENYWTIPGTVTKVEHGNAVTNPMRKTERKSDQEKIVETDEETDLLHESEANDSKKKEILIDEDELLRRLAKRMTGK
jgi:hypothetical protein